MKGNDYCLKLDFRLINFSFSRDEWTNKAGNGCGIPVLMSLLPVF